MLLRMNSATNNFSSMFYLVCAVALAPDVGVDVEDIERPVKPERLQTSPFH